MLEALASTAPTGMATGERDALPPLAALNPGLNSGRSDNHLSTQHKESWAGPLCPMRSQEKESASSSIRSIRPAATKR